MNWTELAPGVFFTVFGAGLLLLPILGGGRSKTFVFPILNLRLSVPSTRAQKISVGLIGFSVMSVGVFLLLAPLREQGTATAHATESTSPPPVSSGSSLSATSTFTAITSESTLPGTPSAIPQSISSATASSFPSPTPIGGSDEIAFVSQGANQNYIYLYTISTGRRTRLPLTEGVDGGIAWSKNGSTWAFSANRGEGLQIYVLTDNGATVDKVSMGTNPKNRPSWSPDGNQIAFEVNEKASNIYIYGFKTRDTHREISDPGDDVDADWSPDSSKLAYVSWASGSADIYEWNILSNTQTLLIATSAPETAPSWSPSGKYLAYTEIQENGAVGIAIYDLDQNKTIHRIVEPKVALDKASWSPDEKWLLMSCQYHEGDVYFEICKYDIDSRTFYRITDNETYEDWPVWLP